MESLIRELLVKIGEDPSREGLLKTPDRDARAWQEMAAGYADDPGRMVREALFTAEGRKGPDISFFQSLGECFRE